MHLMLAAFSIVIVIINIIIIFINTIMVITIALYSFDNIIVMTRNRSIDICLLNIIIVGFARYFVHFCLCYTLCLSSSFTTLFVIILISFIYLLLHLRQFASFQTCRVGVYYISINSKQTVIITLEQNTKNYIKCVRVRLYVQCLHFR